MALSLCLSQLNNRRRWAELEQQNQMTVAEIDEVRQSHQTISQIKKDFLPRQALAAIKFQLRKAENQRILIEQRFLPQFAECQQQIVELENQISGLQKQLTVHKDSPISQSLCKGERGRVIIFIDAANLYHALLEKDWEIDYGKLLDFLSANGSLVAAYFYTGVAKNQQGEGGF